RHVFGVPGGQTLAVSDAILDREPDLRHVLVRDERSAAYAADGYSRVTGRAGVCDATVGPGAAKLPSGLGEALGASVPVVALVSELPARLAAALRDGAGTPGPARVDGGPHRCQPRTAAPRPAGAGATGTAAGYGG